MSANEEHKTYKCKTDDIPSEFIIVQDKGGKGQKLVRLGGLQFLLDQMGEYRIQTKQVAQYGEKYISVEQSFLEPSKEDPTKKVQVKRAVSKLNPTYEVVYECKIFLIPSQEYLSSKGITPDNPCLQLLTEPIVAHGTASTSNLRENMYPYLEVMAETRAVVRAMRFASGCSYTAIDEIGNSDVDIANGIVVQSVGEMAKALEDTFIMQNGVKTPPAAIRSDLIIKIKNAKKRSKGVAEITASFLDRNDAGVVENLSIDQLKELVELIDKVPKE